MTGHPHLNPIDSDTAQPEIQTCCVSEPGLAAESPPAWASPARP